MASKTRVAIDVDQARQLSGLISASVDRLGSLSRKSKKDMEGGDEEAQEREAILTITSAATQLAALVRPPAQVILEVATGVSIHLKFDE